MIVYTKVMNQVQGGPRRTHVRRATNANLNSYARRRLITEDILRRSHTMYKQRPHFVEVLVDENRRPYRYRNYYFLSYNRDTDITRMACIVPKAFIRDTNEQPPRSFLTVPQLHQPLALMRAVDALEAVDTGRLTRAIQCVVINRNVNSDASIAVLEFQGNITMS